MMGPVGDHLETYNTSRRGGKPSLQDIYGKKMPYNRQAGSYLKTSPSINGAPKSYHNLRIRQ
jgi:hypothetical protein